MDQSQYRIWAGELDQLKRTLRMRPPLERERDLLELLERILLRVRLAVGLGEPSVRTTPIAADAVGEVEEEGDEDPPAVS